MAEQGLGWRPDGPDPRPAQLDRIASLAALPHMAVRVIRCRRRDVRPPDDPVHGLRGDGGGLVAIELLPAAVETTRREEYQADLEQLRRSALSGDPAIAFIRDLAARLA